MTLQEFIDFDEYVRCICIGKDRVLPIQYDPKRIGRTGLRGAYLQNDRLDWLPAPLHARVVEDSIKINRALNYDMNSVEFAVKDGVPYAIDFTNPAPDMDYWSLKEKFFAWVVKAMADMCIEKAKAGRIPPSDMRWNKLLNA